MGMGLPGMGPGWNPSTHGKPLPVAWVPWVLLTSELAKCQPLSPFFFNTHFTKSPLLSNDIQDTAVSQVRHWPI